MDNFSEDIEKLREKRPDLAVSFRSFKILEEVFRWLGKPGSPQVGAIEQIAQDEFSHDLMFELTETEQFLVFGAT